MTTRIYYTHKNERFSFELAGNRDWNFSKQVDIKEAKMAIKEFHGVSNPSFISKIK